MKNTNVLVRNNATSITHTSPISYLYNFSFIQKFVFACFLGLLIPIFVFGNQTNNGKNKAKVKNKHTYNSSIGNWVWLDLNRDGIHDEFEEGLNDFTVILYSVKTNQVFSTKTNFHTKTGKAGYYQFNNLPAGKYRIIFEIPEGFEASPKDVDNNRNDILDSDADPISGATDIIFLKNGRKEKSWSIGLCLPTMADVE